jgi:hypothetical protein
MKTTLDYGALYADLHDASGGKFFAGKVRGLEKVIELVQRTKPQRLLDYGCGKGYQYLARRQHESWGGLLPYCYDIGVRQLSERPEGKFDGVICCDMMEHIDGPDVDRVLDDVFGFSSVRQEAESFVYFHISCIPSRGKTLPDGRNVHLTLEAPEWWNSRLQRYARPGLIIEAKYETA